MKRLTIAGLSKDEALTLMGIGMLDKTRTDNKHLEILSDYYQMKRLQDEEYY